MGTIRTFEKEDWYAYAGAERFSNDQEPLILELELEFNAEATIIADKNGISIDLGNGENVDGWAKELQLSRTRAHGELRAIQKAVEGITYAPDLAYEIDHPSDEALKGFDYIGELY